VEVKDSNKDSSKSEIAMKKINPETTVRWRITYDNDGNEIRESNARFVRWSNGSIQLFIAGNTEIMDVESKPIEKDHLQLFATQKGIVQCNGKLDSRMFFSPSSIHSKSHQKLTMALAGQAKSRTRKVKFVGNIPSEGAQKAELDKARSQKLLEDKQRKKMTKLGIEEEEGNYGTSDSEGEGGTGGKKRRRNVDEKKILGAQSGREGSPVRRERKKRKVAGGGKDEGKVIDRTESDDEFINDDEEEDGEKSPSEKDLSSD